MKKSYWILLAFLILPHTVTAQTGTCERALAEAYLDAGNVRARILNNGGLFWRGSPNVYEVPKGGNSNAIFTANIWIGALIDDEVHTSASRYGPWEFWAGPLDEQGNAPASCKPFDKIWEITRQDLEAFVKDNVVSNNLRNWPWHLGAPVVDGDHNPDNYNLEGGDLPELLGDQRLWWIMNDRGNIHEATDSQPLGIEVRASAFAFDTAEPLSNFTFYNYKIVNRNPKPLTKAYFGLYTDVDLGNFDDDLVGSDSLLHLGYYYNGDNVDEGGEGYGIAPPAIGFTYLQTPVADADQLDNDRDGTSDEPGEMLGTSSVFYFIDDGGRIYGTPQTATDYYSYMQARWKDGSRVTEGYDGVYLPDNTPPKPTNFYFSGDPVTQSYWSELNYDGQGSVFHPADRRYIISSGPFDIAPDDTATVNFAIIWSRGASNLDSVTRLKQHTSGVRSTADWLYAPVIVEAKPSPAVQHVLGFDQNFPNPFSQSTTLRYSLPQTMQVRLAVYDLLGREVALLVDAQQEAGIHTAEFDAGDLPPGTYLARIELDFLQFTKHMVLVR